VIFDARSDAAEVLREHHVEVVEVLLAVHEQRAGDLVEALQRALVEAQGEARARLTASCAPTGSFRLRSA
jgi:hypothetical protein